MAGRVQSFTRWFVIVAFVVGASRAHAAPLSGTVRYNGSRGTVSSSTPIVLFLFTTPSPGDEDPQHFSVTTNGGSFNYDVAAGTYYLAFVLDLNGDGEANVGEPASIYNNRTSFPGDPIVAPRTGLALQFNDTGGIPGIAGTITYTGHLGTVSDSTRLRVDVFADADLTIPGDAGGEAKTSSNPGRYDLIIFDHTPRYLCAYFDVNGNQQLDAEEPFQIYNGKTSTPADSVVASTSQTHIDFNFGDPSAGNVLLTGTVHYTGSRGPVSASRPITLILSSDSSFHSDDVDQTTVTTNPGNFTLHAPSAGDYYLAIVLDVVPNGQDNNVNVGEPFQIYNGRFHLPADPLTLPRSGLAITFNDTGRLPGVAGTVTYSGTLGQIDSNHKLIVQRFVDPALTQSPDRDQEAELDSNGGRYDFIGDLVIGTYYLMAFFDVNGNFQYDLGEPFEIYNNKNAPPANAVVSGPDTTNINFNFADENAGPSPSSTPSQTLTPTPTATKTPPPTCTPLLCGAGEVPFCSGNCSDSCGAICATPTLRPTLGPCIGDCGDDGSVTVEELIIGVNVALGVAPLSRCPSFDTDHSNDVTVDELIRGVNAALLGCVPVPTPTGTATATPTASATVTTDNGGPTRTPSPSLTVALTATATATTAPVTPGQLARAVAGHAAIAADAFGAIPAVITAIATGFQLGGSSAALGLAASDGGAAGACPGGGTVMRQCVPNGPGGVIIQFVFDPDGCVINTPDGVAKLTGSISLSGSGGGCVVLPPIAATAKLHVEFAHEGQSTLTVTADLSGIVATPNFEGSCFITAADLTLSGGLRTQLPDGRGASVDFSNTAVHVLIEAFNVNCIPLKYALTFNDSAQFTELASGEQFVATFDTFVFSQDATLNPTEVQLNGGVTSNCLGEQVTLATLTPMLSRFGTLCFQGGVLRAMSSTAQERVVYLDGGGVGIDSNNDGSVDQTFDSCLVPELLLCP
ncbi:MAG: hypothetical protein HYR72_07335 [Deltaproteobacteria bacterium]|nr:hypothetical protein [Deltaproteobacteria bacterium]MBI3386654.1 hypothetical protein [Deltaproteobacteria bacterium]